MKHLLLKSIVFAIIIFFSSCSKSDNTDSGTNLSPLEKEYKALTSDNVNSFFIQSSQVFKGCAGSNCNSSYTFNFKNLSKATDITLYTQAGIIQTKSIWSYYTSETEKVGVFGDYSVSQYKLKYTLKDGRVLISDWIRF